MPFREKTAWIALIAYGFVFGGYFTLLWLSWGDGYGRGLSIGLMVGAVVLLVIITTVLAILAALTSPRGANAPADEREQLIELKSERIASYTLSIGVVLLIGALLMNWSGVLVANLLLAAMVLAEVVKASARIFFFRVGV